MNTIALTQLSEALQVKAWEMRKALPLPIIIMARMCDNRAFSITFADDINQAMQEVELWKSQKLIINFKA